MISIATDLENKYPSIIEHYNFILMEKKQQFSYFSYSPRRKCSIE